MWPFSSRLANALEAWSIGRARRAVEAVLDLVAADRAPAGAGRLGGGGARWRSRGGRPLRSSGRGSGCRSTERWWPAQRRSTRHRSPARARRSRRPRRRGVRRHDQRRRRRSRCATTAPGEATTTLARILRLVEEAQARRSPSERWVERFARVYTPAVMLIALAIFLGPPLAAGAAWSAWFYRALVVLVIGCPCALVISTPVSVVASLAAAARRGVLIKAGAFVEDPGPAAGDGLRQDRHPDPREAARGRSGAARRARRARSCSARAAALEARSAHPLARGDAPTSRRERGASIVRPAADTQVLPGKGVRRNGRRGSVLAGLPPLPGRARAGGSRGPPPARGDGRGPAARWSAVGNDRHVCGLLAVADALRPEASAAVAALRRQGLEHLVMLTGDNRPTAAAIAAEVGGIEEVRAELLPARQGRRRSRSWSRRYGEVAMVGDGSQRRAGDGAARGSASPWGRRAATRRSRPPTSP